jgi:hypothetical protein
MTRKVTWNDIQTATQSELKKVYKVDARQLENQVRKHLDGANATERRGMYQMLYSRRDR